MLSTKKGSSLPPMDSQTPNPLSIWLGPLGIAGVCIRLFSNLKDRRRPLPPAVLKYCNEDTSSDDGIKHKKVKHIRLITITASHFCEKVRWGLDLLEQDQELHFSSANDTIIKKNKKGTKTNNSDDDDYYYYYTEDCHPPGFHFFPTLDASNNQSTKTPMIVIDNYDNKGDSKCMWDSVLIMQELCPFLYPESIKNEIIQYETELGKRMGATTRCIGYYYLLGASNTTTTKKHQYYEYIKTMMTQYSTEIEKQLYDKMFNKGVDKGILNGLCINHETAKNSIQEIRTLFMEISTKLSSLRQQDNNNNNHNENDDNDNDSIIPYYIMDTPTKKYGFTAVDLTFAALSYVLLQPIEMFPISLYDDSNNKNKQFDPPPELVDLGNELRKTLAGQHAIQVYKKHRPVFKQSKREKDEKQQELDTIKNDDDKLLSMTDSINENNTINENTTTNNNNDGMIVIKTVDMNSSPIREIFGGGDGGYTSCTNTITTLRMIGIIGLLTGILSSYFFKK